MKLSIITVNLNNLEGLKKTYESVVSQTFTDYEWLVIDGGSTDGSREFIEEHQDKFSYWCSEPDKGIYNAMNKGIVRAKGEYLNFMNSGDCFACEDTLAGVFGVSRTADILYGYMMLRDINGEPVSWRNMKEEINWYNLYYFSLHHQSSFIRREAFHEVGLYDEECRIVSDWKWFVKAFLTHGVSSEFLPYKIAIFQDNGISRTDNIQFEKEQQRKTLFPKYLTDNDADSLYLKELIYSFRVTRFLYRVLIIVALKLDIRRRKRVKQHLSTHFYE